MTILNFVLSVVSIIKNYLIFVQVVETSLLSKMNIKFTIEYKGTNFHGWQVQNNVITIQGELNKAFHILLPNIKFNIIGSGRTDAGVHAFNQIASVKLPEKLNLDKFFKSVNGIIDNDIYVKHYEKVSDDFNARFSTSRLYNYHIHTKYYHLKQILLAHKFLH